MSWREDRYTSNPDAAAAFEEARAYNPSRLELAEEAGYDRHDPTLGQPSGLRSPEIAAAVEEAARRVREMRATVAESSRLRDARR